MDLRKKHEFFQFLSLSVTLILLFPILTYADHIQDNIAATQLTEMLNNITIINAHFTQTVTNKSGLILQEQLGTIQLKKPNLLHWQVLSPDHMLIVTDGNKIWNYDLDLEQVTVKNFSSEITNTKIASLLFGDLQKMLNNFNVVNLNNECNTDYCFELNNKNNNTSEEDSFTKAHLGFNKSKQLTMLRLYDQLDQETVFNFVKFKNTVDNKLFKFTVPDGVDVIEE